MVVGSAFVRVAEYSVGGRDFDEAGGGSRIIGIVIGVVDFREAIECSIKECQGQPNCSIGDWSCISLSE